MRHKHGYNTLGMKSSHRKAVLRNMASSLLLHERIRTTLPKAKELRRVVDRIITLGKRGDLHARRQAEMILFDSDATQKVFKDLANRFKDRPGGYTRILRVGHRTGDQAQLALIELVDYEFKSGAESEKPKSKAPKAKET